MKDSSKKLYTLFNYVAKTLATISQMCATVLNDADTRGNGTSLNHKNVIHMGIHATTLFSHVQVVTSKRSLNNRRGTVESKCLPLWPKTWL